MGRRRANQGSPNAGKPKLPDPVLEVFSVAPESISVPELFKIVEGFSQERRKQLERLNKAQEAINEVYNSFTVEQRVRFFSMLYDRFAERYDEHMGVETKHYPAIRRVMVFAMPYLRLPILDLTAGTGEPLKYAIEYMDASKALREAGIPLTERISPHLAPDSPVQTDLTYQIHANEVSHRMLENAERKLSGFGKVGFTDYSALTLPDHLKGKFSTVICSQTFHLIADEDKTRLVISIREALRPGGFAVIMEEDPFRITPTAPIEAVSLFLRSVVRPIKPDALIGRFEVNGFTKLEERAVAPIDSEHSMRLHIFQKN
jgi:SAM-dependent methyltransferase